MTFIKMLDLVRDWAQTEICDKLFFKEAPQTDAQVNERYEYKLVHPRASSMYFPTDLTPNGTSFLRNYVPCCVVAPIETRVQMADGKSRVKLTLMFAVWSPGLYVKDFFEPQADDRAELPDVLTYRQSEALTIADKNRGFIPDNEGWRDAYIFQQAAIDALKATDCIGQLVIDKNAEMSCDPYTENGAVTNFYPYFYTHVDFTVEWNDLSVSSDEVEKFL